MRTLLLASTSLLALSVSVAAASADATAPCNAGTIPADFSYAGSLQTCTVPAIGEYKTEAIAGSGGTEPYRILHRRASPCSAPAWPGSAWSVGVGGAEGSAQGTPLAPAAPTRRGRATHDVG